MLPPLVTDVNITSQVVQLMNLTDGPLSFIPIISWSKLILPQNLRCLAEPPEKFLNPIRARDPNFGNVGQNYCY